MKKIFILMLLTYTVGSFAQDVIAKEDMDIVQAYYGKNKKELVTQFIKVPEQKSTEFWKVYNDFETERRALVNRKVELVNDYMSNYDKLDDLKVDALAKETLKNNMNHEKLYSKYYELYKKILGATEAFKIIHLEVYLQTEISAGVRESIPFIGELEKNRAPDTK